MDDQFDKVHLNALVQIKNKEDKPFVLYLLQKEQPESMVDIDKKLKQKEENHWSIQKWKLPKKRTYKEMEQQFTTIHQFFTLETDDLISRIQYSKDDIENQSFSIIVQQISTTGTPAASEKMPVTWGILNFSTLYLSEVFDRCKTTDINRVYILTAAA